MVQGLWASLKRAAETHWGMESQVLPAEKGFRFTIRLASSIPTGTWKSAGRYIKNYARACGWPVTQVKRHKTWIEFNATYQDAGSKKNTKK